MTGFILTYWSLQIATLNQIHENKNSFIDILFITYEKRKEPEVENLHV